MDFATHDNATALTASAASSVVTAKQKSSYSRTWKLIRKWEKDNENMKTCLHKRRDEAKISNIVHASLLCIATPVYGCLLYNETIFSTPSISSTF
jgi:hypothetical protein